MQIYENVTKRSRMRPQYKKKAQKRKEEFAKKWDNYLLKDSTILAFRKNHYFFADRQSFPTPISTRIGTAKSTTHSITSLTSVRMVSISSSGTSTTSSSWTCMSIRDPRFFSRMRVSSSIIASFMISAAVHWIGILIASLSAHARVIRFASFSHSICLLRQK